MIEADTIKLLRECDAGVKMGVSSIDEVAGRVQSEEFRSCMEESKREHEQLGREIEEMLDRYQDEGKDPNPVIKGMSWMKANIMLSVESSDKMIADLMTDGCNMGVKSLNRYLNQYEAAEERAKDIAKRLINLEEKLAVDMRDYL